MDLNYAMRIYHEMNLPRECVVPYFLFIRLHLIKDSGFGHMKYKTDTNEETLRYYNTHADSFAQDTTEAKMTEIQDRFLAYLPPGSHILDLGCGTGRDSKLFRDRQYKVTALDGSPELCKIAKTITGQEILCMRYDEIQWVEAFEGIWACASLLHIESDQLPYIMKKAIDALKRGGIIYISFKYGDFEGIQNGRYYTNMTEEMLGDFLNLFPEMQALEQWVSDDVRPGRECEKWLNIICRKLRETI